MGGPLPKAHAAIYAPFDHVWDTNHGLTLNGNHAARWEPVKGTAYLDQSAAVCQPRLSPMVHANGHPVLWFSGTGAHMEFRGLGAKSGPHTLIFVIKPLHDDSPRYLFDSQQGGPLVRVPWSKDGPHWVYYEYVGDSVTGITGQTVLGASYYGTDLFFRGYLAFVGYKNGVMATETRAYLQQALTERYKLKGVPQCAMPCCKVWQTLDDWRTRLTTSLDTLAHSLTR
jgi:hypothetical protein